MVLTHDSSSPWTLSKKRRSYLLPEIVLVVLAVLVLYNKSEAINLKQEEGGGKELKKDGTPEPTGGVRIGRNKILMGTEE